MSVEELEEFLASQVACRVATINAAGPHITGMAFVWDGQHIWVNSNVHTQRLVDIGRDPRVAVHVEEVGNPVWFSRFVEMRGEAQVVGEVPRVGQPHPELEAVETQYAAKYGDAVLPMIHEGDGPLGGHAWLRITPTKILSKTGSLRATAGEAS